MSKNLLPKLAKEFLDTYDAPAKDRVWQGQSDAFRKSWSEKVLAPGDSSLSDEACDAIIRILDRSGKGNTKDTEAVARTMVTQGAWRRMLKEFRTNKRLAALVNSILETGDANQKAVLIDELYRVNEGQRNNLTGQSGNAINAFLAAFDPFKNLSVISLKDRRTLIEFLDLSVPFDWERSAWDPRLPTATPSSTTDCKLRA